MTRRASFAARPSSPDRWIADAHGQGSASTFTARLTIDVTPEMRGRIKVAAFRRGLTVADMLRELLAREYPETEGREP